MPRLRNEPAERWWCTAASGLPELGWNAQFAVVAARILSVDTRIALRLTALTDLRTEAEMANPSTLPSGYLRVAFDVDGVGVDLSTIITLKLERLI